MGQGKSTSLRRRYLQVPAVSKITRGQRLGRKSLRVSVATATVDNAEHTIFECPFWEDSGMEPAQSLRRSPRPKDVLQSPSRRSRILLLLPSNQTMMFSTMFETIMGLDRRNSSEQVKRVNESISMMKIFFLLKF